MYIAARAEFESRASFAFLSVPPSQRFMDPTPLAPDPGTFRSEYLFSIITMFNAMLILSDDRNNPEDRPGKRVRQQTGDVITLLRALQVQSQRPAQRTSYL